MKDINVYYPEGGSGTTNLNWAIERILTEERLLQSAQTPNGVPCILRLERYIQEVVWQATGGMNIDDIDTAALEANRRFFLGGTT